MWNGKIFLVKNPFFVVLKIILLNYDGKFLSGKWNGRWNNKRVNGYTRQPTPKTFGLMESLWNFSKFFINLLPLKFREKKNWNRIEFLHRLDIVFFSCRAVARGMKMNSRKCFLSFVIKKCHCRRHHPRPPHLPLLSVIFIHFFRLKFSDANDDIFFFLDSTRELSTKMKHFTPHTQRLHHDGLEFAKRKETKKEMFSSTHNVRLHSTLHNSKPVLYRKKKQAKETKENHPPAASFSLMPLLLLFFYHFLWLSADIRPDFALPRDTPSLCYAEHRSGPRGWSNYQEVIKSVFISCPPIFRLDSTLFNIRVRRDENCFSKNLPERESKNFRKFKLRFSAWT